MNTIKSMINLFLMFVVAATLQMPLTALADDGYGYSISDVEARQRWPWERKVDISFHLTQPAGMPADQLVRIGVVASNETSEVVVSPGSLRGTAVSPGGTCRIIWDPTVDHSTRFLPHLKFSLSVVSTNAVLEYMVVDLVTGGVTYQNDLLAEGINSDLYKTDKMAFRYFSPGTFIMADGTYAKETTLTKGYYIGVFQVTQAQWKNVTGNYPGSYFTEERDMRPTETVKYDDIRGKTLGGNWPNDSQVDADSFLGVLRNRTGINELDLPTEAQWEYACRSGTTTYYNDGNPLAPIDGVSLDPAESNVYLNVLGRYRYNGGYIDGDTNAPPADCSPMNGTAVVGSYLPNAAGLYDMHGNVYELCRDRWHNLLVGGEDPVGKPDVTYNHCVHRGGSWTQMRCSAAQRIVIV